MLRIIILALGVSAGGWYWMNTQDPGVPFTEYNLPAKELRGYMKRSASVDDHPCLNRSKCLVLYVSPWCPSCQSTKNFVPYVRDAIANESDAGFIVVVGRAWGNFERGYDMVRDIGGQVYIDEEATYWKELRRDVNAIPAWLVINGDGNVLETETGSPRQHSLKSAQSFLSDLGV